MFTAATVTCITGVKNPTQVCKADSTVMHKINILHEPLKRIGFPGSFIKVCASVLNELRIAVDVSMMRRYSKLEDMDYDDEEVADEHTDLERYMMVIEERLGEDVWEECMKMCLSRDECDIMIQFRCWGFAKLANRMMERELEVRIN